MRSFLFLSVFLSFAGVYSFGASNLDDCAQKLSNLPKIQVIAPGEEDKGARIQKENEEVTRVAKELGLETPNHQINIVPSGQLDSMVGSGTHPAPHWHEGAELARSMQTVSGVLEFVTPGCPTCRSYYSSSTPPTEQQSILMHVAGHNDVFATSRYIQIRSGDSPLAAYQLAETMGEAYQKNDHDEVSLYFQYLKSLEYLQDFVGGTFEEPSKFSNEPLSPLKKNSQATIWSKLSNGGGSFLDSLSKPTKAEKPNGPNGWNKTTSVLQALTENLPPQSPEWQRSIINLFEASRRAYPGTFQTKIMNEGWATLMMYILARHLPWTTSSDLVKYGQLISGVAVPGFDNPYWLGVSGWWNLYEQFEERPEIKGLDVKERDKRFIKWARDFYSTKNDSEWAKAALDERWISKMRFFLYRPTTNNEFDYTKPTDKQKFITLSRDWKRIRNYILSRHVDNKLQMMPSIALLNPINTPGVLALNQESTEMGIPMDLPSAAKTSFVIAQLVRKPVQLNALFIPQNRFGFSAKPGKLTVQPDGQVHFESGEEVDKAVSEQLQIAINDYKDDILASFHSGISDLMSKQWTKLAALVGDANSKDAPNMVEFAPQTAGALREYLQLVELRLRRAVQESLKNGTANFGRHGVKVKVLPEVPHYSFIRGFTQDRARSRPIGPIDYPGKTTDHDFQVDENGTLIGVGPLLPGDKFGPKEKSGQGDGDGEGEGDGDGDGDGDGNGNSNGNGNNDGDNPSPGHGNGHGDPGDLDIPLKLYGELLAEVLELPNIRRTKGKNTDSQTIRRGSVSKPNGNILWDETLMVAIEKARAIRRGKNLPYDSTVPIMDLIKEALPLVEKTDYVVSGRMIKAIPDFDAVLVVNVDLTGSMGGERIRLAKNLVFNMQALLLANYKNVIIRYVGFDTVAKEMSEKEIFSKFFGGGTNYTSAIDLDKKILEEYSNKQVNKYIVTIGDGETSAPDAASYVNGIRDIQDDLQYAGYAMTNENADSPWAGAIVDEHKKLKNEWKWVGVGLLRHAGDMLQALKDLFPKDSGQ